MAVDNKAIVKKETVDVVAEKIRQFKESGELHLPDNYSAENAMKSAWLILQNTVDRDKKPALQVCTKDSIANALLDMVVQGLNPAKKQVYFIVYGNQLSCQRSYFGTMAVTKQVADAKDIYAQVVYAGDEFEYELVKGEKVVTKHVQKIENVASDKIVAAYCVVELSDGQKHTDIMTIGQIKKSWAKGKAGPAVQNDFSEEMAKRTVINRACKPIINSSNDSHLMLETFNRIDSASVEKSAVDEIAEHANSETIDIVAEPITEKQPSSEKLIETTVIEAEKPKQGPDF
jgi:recombination protein RecT